MSFNTNTKNNDEWLTPIDLVRSLGEFDLDPCSPSPEKRTWDTAITHYHKEMDGLSKEWFGRVWLNPPYGKETFKWINKLSEHKSGIALIFARTETKGFHEHIWGKADSVFFFKGRIRFFSVYGGQGQYPNAPSCLISYSAKDTMSIYKAHKHGLIKGKLVLLSK